MIDTFVQAELNCYVISGSNLFHFYYLEYRAELYWRLESKRMKALSKENTPFVNEVAPADQNNNVLDENNKGSNKEVNLHDSLEKKSMTFFFYYSVWKYSRFWSGAAGAVDL